MSDLDDIRADLAAFADDDEEVIVDLTGESILVRGGQEIAFRFVVEEDSQTFVEYKGEKLPYTTFLARHLAKLDILAERLLTKRDPVPSYVDGTARLVSPTSPQASGRAYELLNEGCRKAAPFSARVLFITADAGQGKTALLRQYQHDQAQRYLAGESRFLFWHVDLQGRQLLRLSEALMGDLGDLRVSGLWMPAILRLLRHRALVLAIDGFDELAAEQGGADALGALAMLVQRLGDRGTIVAASRRTFFDTDDYIARARLFSRTGGGDCQFDQLTLDGWCAPEALQYLTTVSEHGQSFSDPQATYDEIVAELGSAEHPMVTRPFLLAQVARALLRFDLAPTDFIRGMDDRYQAVGAVIEKFVEREVSEKWKRKETGEPFLTAEQHLELLGDVAEEMFRAQRSSLDVETVETLATLRLDEWSIDPLLRQQILEMVRMHVLLTPTEDEGFRQRSFDHEEFRDWFTGYALRERISRLADGEASAARDFLSAAQLPDATARHACSLIERSPETVNRALGRIVELVDRELRPTYLQINAGTLIPYLIDHIEPADRFLVDAKAVYSSLVLERTRLVRVTFRNATCINVSFVGADWNDVVFESSNLGEPTFDRAARYEAVVLRDCRIDGIRVINGDDETREFAPDRIRLSLQVLGVSIADSEGEVAQVRLEVSNGDARRVAKRLLSVFRRTTILPEDVLKRRLPRDTTLAVDTVIPVMTSHGVLEQRAWRGRGVQKAWGLANFRLDEIERADGDPNAALNAFWKELDALG
jgi:hypothetical protein